MTPYDSTPAQVAGEEGKVSVSSNVEDVIDESVTTSGLVVCVGIGVLQISDQVGQVIDVPPADVQELIRALQVQLPKIGDES